jgi:Rieske Fe-S protein
LGDRALGATKPVVKKRITKKPVAKKPAAKKPVAKTTSKPTPIPSASATPTQPPNTAPDAPVIGKASATGATGATVAFTAPVKNGGAPITSYVATSNPGGIKVTLPQSDSGTFTFAGLTGGTAYTFTVVAVNSVGTSSASAASYEIEKLDEVPGTAVAIKKSGVALTLADIEVGKTVSATNSATNTNLFVSRLAEDSFKGYPTSCTHQGGPLSIQGKTLDCPWHGSKYDALTGAVSSPPAATPLTPIKVAALNGALYIL